MGVALGSGFPGGCPWARRAGHESAASGSVAGRTRGGCVDHPAARDLSLGFASRSKSARNRRSAIIPSRDPMAAMGNDPVAGRAIRVVGGLGVVEPSGLPEGCPDRGRIPLRTPDAAAAVGKDGLLGARPWRAAWERSSPTWSFRSCRVVTPPWLGEASMLATALVAGSGCSVFRALVPRTLTAVHLYGLRTRFAFRDSVTRASRCTCVVIVSVFFGQA